ncbi:Uncharacterised protein [uncultured Blautia sp.]|nr:Uncharacterised protein [uncultured Blautia sp.]
MQQRLPLFIRGSSGPQALGKLLQSGHRVGGVDVRRHLPHQQGAGPEVLAGKTELLQQGQVLQQQRPVLPA